MTEEKNEIKRLAKDIFEIKAKLVDYAKVLLSIEYYLESLSAKWANVFSIFVKGAFVCADPHALSNGHLPGAYDEGQQIEDVLERADYGVTLIRHPASKDDFLTNMSNKSIVHLAGHGSVSGDVYFLFDDGNIYPADIRAQSSVPSLLMYAGVCLGGANDTMANAFRDKGTKYYVGFTRTIPDWDAKYFDDLVYEKWLIEGKSLRTALDEADDIYPALDCWVLWED